MAMCRDELSKETKLIIGVTGTRETPTSYQLEIGIKLLHWFHGGEFHHGDCQGWDEYMGYKAQSLKYETHAHPSRIKTFRAYVPSDIIHPELPPLERNHLIVEKSNIMIAAPKTYHEILRSGTWATIRYARKVKRPTFIIFPDGEIKLENLV